MLRIVYVSIRIDHVCDERPVGRCKHILRFSCLCLMFYFHSPRLNLRLMRFIWVLDVALEIIMSIADMFPNTSFHCCTSIPNAISLVFAIVCCLFDSFGCNLVYMRYHLFVVNRYSAIIIFCVFANARYSF